MHKNPWFNRTDTYIDTFKVYFENSLETYEVNLRLCTGG